MGIGSLETRGSPTLIEALQGTVITEIRAGNSHSAALSSQKDSARCYVWGSNTQGQLGLGQNKGKRLLYPTPLDNLPYCNEIKIALGSNHTMVLTIVKNYEKLADQVKYGSANHALIQSIKECTLFVCGSNSQGQLGIDFGNQSTQVDCLFDLRPVKIVSDNPGPVKVSLGNLTQHR